MRLIRPLRFGFGVETWLGMLRDQQVVVRRYFGPALERRFDLLPDEFILFRLSHPGIQHLLLSGNDDDGAIVQVCEWIDGISLQAVMTNRKGPSLTPLEFTGCIRDGLSALNYLHSECPVKPVVHGDISPGNMIIGPGRSNDRRTLTLTDLKGTAAGADRHEARPIAGVDGNDDLDNDIVVGTLPYMSDEVLSGDPVGCADEIWSLAVAMTAVISGKAPWKDAGSPEAMIRARKVMPATALLESIPVEFQRDSLIMELLENMMATSPIDRPTAGECLKLISISG